MKQLLPTILLVMLISACAPDPRKEAEAYATRIEADQNALNSEQNRQHAEQLHQFELQRRAMDQENQKAIQSQWQLALNRAIWGGSITLIIVVCFSVVSVTRTINQTVEGVGAAFVRRADVGANLIPLDRVTRQFPLFIQHVHGDKYALHNPNAGSVVMLDVSNPADRQMIATSGATQIAGVIAQEARQSTDPAGVSIIQPPIVNVKDELLTVGKDIWRSNE